MMIHYNSNKLTIFLDFFRFREWDVNEFRKSSHFYSGGNGNYHNLYSRRVHFNKTEYLSRLKRQIRWQFVRILITNNGAIKYFNRNYTVCLRLAVLPHRWHHYLSLSKINEKNHRLDGQSCVIPDVDKFSFRCVTNNVKQELN